MGASDVPSATLAATAHALNRRTLRSTPARYGARVFVKERTKAPPGSIPALLGMFEREVRFYREVAGEVGVRVPVCHEAIESGDGCRLLLEDLSSWKPGGDPLEVVRLLRHLHQRWSGIAAERWPWLDREGAAAAEIGALYDRVWPTVSTRTDVTPTLRAIGQSYVGRVETLERREASFGTRTLIHGDASLRNVRTGPSGEVAFIDWEDVRIASGAIDLTWLLASSIRPTDWQDLVAAHGAPTHEIEAAWPYAITQGILAFSDCTPGSAEAVGWIERLEAAGRQVR